jgi:hypothetical protein
MADHDDVELTRTHRAGERGALPSSVQKWGQFSLVRELGHGAFGRVYHARDEALARDIALKIIRLPDPADAATALREGRMLARVRHRNVVTVYGAQQIGDEIGLWMELIHGRSLTALVRDQGSLGPEEATVVGISLCQALAAVHTAGLLHRDVKAQNAMRESGGRIVLTDFGTGRDAAQVTEEDFAGTPAYMAPEVLAGSAASVASDLYSLGVLLFYVVTGEYPVGGQSVLDLLVAHRAGKRRLLSDVRPDLPPGFVRVVERALAPRPEDRHESAGAMMRALADALPNSSSWEGRLAKALSQAGAEPSLLLRDGARPPLTTGMLIARMIMGAFAAAIAVGLLGFLTSAAFNQALERDDFATDRAIDWWIFGARSLVAPLVLATLAVLVSGVVLAIWRAVRRLVRRSRPEAGMAETRLTRPPRVSSAALAQWLLVGQSIAVAAIAWRFRHMLEAVGQPSMVPADYVALLSKEGSETWLYRGALSLVLTGTVAGWYALLARPGTWAFLPRTTVFAAGAVTLCAMLMLEVPYRLMYHNEFNRVSYADRERCYEIGRRAPQVLLYCLDAQPPRIQRVTEHDVRRPPAGVTINESLFP